MFNIFNKQTRVYEKELELRIEELEKSMCSLKQINSTLEIKNYELQQEIITLEQEIESCKNVVILEKEVESSKNENNEELVTEKTSECESFYQTWLEKYKEEKKLERPEPKFSVGDVVVLNQKALQHYGSSYPNMCRIIIKPITWNERKGEWEYTVEHFNEDKSKDFESHLVLHQRPSTYYDPY
jgi:hypothetical protein